MRKVKNGRPGKRVNVIHIRSSEPLKKNLEEMAWRKRMSLTQLVHDICDQWIKDNMPELLVNEEAI